MKEIPSFPERRKTWDEPSFAKCFCAVTVTAVAGVAAAGTAAYSSYSQGQAQKKAQEGLNGDKAGAYGSKVELPDYEDNVNLPQYSPLVGAQDYLSSLPMLSQISKNVTKNAMRSRDSITGGLASENLQQSGVDINALLKGDIPQDVKDKVMRMVAERSGGAFSPNGQDGQAASADFARSIGLTSVDMMKLGLSYAPQWEGLVDSFTYKPQQAFGDALMALRERNSYVTSTAAIQLEKDQRKYISEVNKAKAGAMPDPQVVGSNRDNLTLDTLNTQNQQNTMNAMLGTIKSAAGAYTTMQGAGVSPTTYSSPTAASAAAPYAAGMSYVPGMGYIPKAKAA